MGDDGVVPFRKYDTGDEGHNGLPEEDSALSIYLMRQGVRYGPYLQEDLVRYLGERSVVPHDMAWRDEAEGWVPLSVILGDSSGSETQNGDGDPGTTEEEGKKLTGSLVLKVFNALSGDPTDAIVAAKRYSSEASWRRAQAAQVGVAGGGAMLIPGLHLVGMAADFGFLMHKLAVVSWGIGELKGCVVLGKDDFANILGLWSGAISLEQLDRKAISKAAFQAIAVAGGGTVAGLTAGAIASQMTGQQLAMLGGRLAGSMLARKAVGDGASKGVMWTAGQAGGKLGAKVAGKLAAKFSTKFGAKAVAGTFLGLGPIVGASVNVHFIRSIAKSASSYYAAAV